MKKFFLLFLAPLLFLYSFSQQSSFSDNLLLQRGHSNSIYGLSFSGDGTYLLSAGGEGEVILWEVERSIEVSRFTGFNSVPKVQFCNHDSDFLVEDKAIIYKFDINTRQKIHTFKSNYPVNNVIISKDGNYISTIFLDTVRLYETNNFTLLHTYPHFNKIQFSSKVFLLQNDSSVAVVEYKKLDHPIVVKISTNNNVYYSTPDEKFVIINNLSTLSFIKARDTAWKRKEITDVRDISFAAEGNMLVTNEELHDNLWNAYSSIGIYNLLNGKEIHFIPYTSEARTIAVSPNGKFVATASIDDQLYDAIKIWDTKTGRLSFALYANQADIHNFVFDKNTRCIYTSRTYGTFQKWNPYKGEGVVWSSDQRIYDVTSDMQMNSRGDAIAVADGGSVSLFSSVDGSFMKSFSDDVKQVRFWPDDGHLITVNKEQLVKVRSLQTGNVICSAKVDFDITTMLPVSDSEITIVGTPHNLGNTIESFIWDPSRQKLLKKSLTKTYNPILSACIFNKGFVFSTDETNDFVNPTIFVENKYHQKTGEITGFESFVEAMAVVDNTLIAGDDSGYIYLADLDKYKIISRKKYSNRSIESIVILDDTKKAFAVIASQDSYVSLFSFPSLQPIFKMFDNDNGWLLLNPQGYYFGSKTIDDFVYFKQNNHIYSFDQFDMWYNRPDIVLGRLPAISSDIINAYKAAYKKRIKKMNLEHESLALDIKKIYVPSINVSLQDSLSRRSRSIDVHISAFDSISTFRNLLVFVNGVPEKISRKVLTTGHTIDTTIRIELSQGNNKIEISVRNNLGFESYKERRMVYQADSSIHPNLYMLLYGDAKFLNQLYNLKYASKDAGDLATFFSTKNTYYKNIHSILLTNEACTRQNFIDSLQYLIRHAGVNDNVILFFGTHGMTLNNEYYLATYDMNFLQPAEKGIDFELVDSMMYLVKSRKKTILIDACQSGEVDKDAVPVLQKRIHMPGLVLRSAGPALTTSEKDKKAFTLMKDQFTVLERQSGTTVLAASSGIDAAIESPEWQNGLFTYVVLQGLKSKDADLDRNDIITIMELKKYTDKKVLELSNGLQQSSSRTENMIYDFRIE